MNDWKLCVILAAIGLAVFYLRNYVREKAKNLAQKEDLQDLTKIVEDVRSQFERANLVHRVQFEAEFRACQDVWRGAHSTHREFVRLFPMSYAVPEAGQRKKFGDTQLAFSDTLVQCQPFVSDAVWKAVYEFEGLMIVWKDADLPLASRTDCRDEAFKGLERCVQEIRKRFSELLVV